MVRGLRVRRHPPGIRSCPMDIGFCQSNLVVLKIEHFENLLVLCHGPLTEPLPVFRETTSGISSTLPGRRSLQNSVHRVQQDGPVAGGMQHQCLVDRAVRFGENGSPAIPQDLSGFQIGSDQPIVQLIKHRLRRTNRPGRLDGPDRIVSRLERATVGQQTFFRSATGSALAQRHGSRSQAAFRIESRRHCRRVGHFHDQGVGCPTKRHLRTADVQLSRLRA